VLCCYSYSNPALAYTQQYNVGDTGPNGGTVTSSTLTSVITNTEVTLNGGFEDTTTTTNWTETVVEEIATSTTTTQQVSQITATTTSNFVPTINSSDWSTEGRIKLQGATQCRTGGSSATVGAGEACTGYQHNNNNSLLQDANNYNFTALGGGQITSEKFEMGPDLTIAEIQSGMTLNYGVDVESHKSNTSVGLCSATSGDCKDVFRITTKLYRCADCYGGGKFAEYSNTVTLTYSGTQTHSFTQDLSSTMLTNNNVTEVWGQMELWGVDAGYHTGYYGPVFSNPFMTLTYDAVTQITQTITQIILSDQTTVYNTSEDTITSVFIGDPTTDTTIPDIDFTDVESFEIVIVNEDTGGGIEMEFSVEVDETTNVATVEMETTNMDTGVVAIDTIVEIDLNLDFGSMDTGPMDVNMPSVESIEADIGSQIDTAVGEAIAEIEIDLPDMSTDMGAPDVNMDMADAGPVLEIEVDTNAGPNVEVEVDAGPEPTVEVEVEVDSGPEPTTEISTSEGNNNEPEPSTSESESSESTDTASSNTEEVQESSQNAEQPVEESNSESEGSSDGDSEAGEDTSESETESEASDSGEQSESSDTEESTNESSTGGEKSDRKSGNDSKGKGKETKSKSKTNAEKKKEYVERKVAEAKQKIATRILAAMADTYSAINETTKIALIASLTDTKSFQAYLDKQNALPLDWYTSEQIYTEMPMLQDPAGILYDMAQDKIMDEMIMEQYK